MPFSTVTLTDGRKFTTKQEFASFLDQTAYDNIKTLLPSNYKFSMDVIDQLKTDNTGLLSRVTEELGLKIISDITQTELNTMKPETFQLLQQYIPATKLTAIPVAKIVSLLDFPNPIRKWSINIAKWLPVTIAKQLNISNPTAGFFFNLDNNALSLIAPKHFNQFGLEVYKNIFGTSYTLNSSGEYVWDSPKKSFRSFSSSQLQNILPAVLDDLIKLYEMPPTIDSPFKITQGTGLLKRLTKAQVLALSPEALARTHTTHFKYLSATELAGILAGFSKAQLHVLSYSIIKEVLDDNVAQALDNLGKLNEFLNKVTTRELTYLSNSFFKKSEPVLTNEQHTYLNGLTVENITPPSRQLREMLALMGPGDARKMGTGSFFKKIAPCIGYIPAAFFKGFTAQQAKELSLNAVAKLRYPQIQALGDRLLEFTETQIKLLSRKQLADISKNIAPRILSKYEDLQIPINRIQFPKDAEAADWLYKELQNPARRAKSLMKIKKSPVLTKTLIKYHWNDLSAELKAAVISGLLDKDTPLSIFTEAQLLKLDHKTAAELLKLKGGLRGFANKLVKIPEYGIKVHNTLMRGGFYHAGYEASPWRFTGGSANKYDAQIFITFGKDFGQQLDSLAYGVKMAETVPTLIYHYNSDLRVPELVDVVNGRKSDEYTLLNNKSNIRTYILGHGNPEQLTIGGIEYYEVYQVIEQLWAVLSIDFSSQSIPIDWAKRYTKLAILGCELANPPIQKDMQGGIIPQQPDYWNTNFEQSFLGKLSKEFYYDRMGQYQDGRLKISAFKAITNTGTGGKTRIKVSNTVVNSNGEDKIVVSWDKDQRKIVRATSRSIKTQAMAQAPLNASHLEIDLSENELHENFIHDLASAIIDPLSLNNALGEDTRGLDVLSSKKIDNEEIMIMQRNNEDGDTASTFYIWDVKAQTDESAMVEKNEIASIIRASKDQETLASENAVQQLKILKKNRAEISALTETSLAQTTFSSIKANDIKEIKTLINSLGGIVDTKEFNKLKPVYNDDYIQTLRAMVVTDTKERNDLNGRADKIFEAISVLTPETSKTYLSDRGIVKWEGSTKMTVYEDKLKVALSDTDITARLKVIGALLHLNKTDGQLLTDALIKSADSDVKQFGKEINSQRQTIETTKSGLAPDVIEKGAQALNVYFLATGIAGLIKDWNTISATEKGIDLTLITGNALASVANLVVIKSLQKSMSTMLSAGMKPGRGILTMQKILIGLDFALAGFTMASIGLQWDDFWRSGLGTNSYIYKSLVANTVNTVVFTAAGLAVSGAVLGVSLSTAIAGTAIGTVAASAGPIGLAIAAASIIVGGIAQGAILLNEYGNYYRDTGDKVEQFFASWIGIETLATKKARILKAAADSASAYQTILNNDWAGTKDYLAKYYAKQGYEKIFYRDKSFAVVSLTRCTGDTRNPDVRDGFIKVYDSILNVRELAGEIINEPTSTEGIYGYAFINLGNEIPETDQYIVRGHPDKNNLFDIRNASVWEIIGGKGDDQFIFDQHSRVNNILAKEGKNTIIWDANESSIVLKTKDAEQPDSFIFLTNSYTTNFFMADVKIVIYNAKDVDIQDAPNDAVFDISGITGARLKIRGGEGSNIYILREGNEIICRGNDNLFWDGKGNVQVSFEAISWKNTQLISIDLSSAPDLVKAYKTDNSLIISCKEKKITIHGIYLQNGTIDISKSLIFMGVDKVPFSLSSLSVMSATPTLLANLPKTFLLSNRSGGTSGAAKLLTSDQGINTYNFSKNAGQFKLDFYTSHFNQLLLESPKDALRYKKSGSDLIIECKDQELSLFINGYYSDLHSEGLLKLWIKSPDDPYAQTYEVMLPDQEDLVENTFVPVENTSSHVSLPFISPKEIIDLNSLTSDSQILITNFQNSNTELHISIPEWADSTRVIQCQRGNDLGLYLADHEEAGVKGNTSPILYIRDFFKSENTKHSIFLHQNQYQIQLPSSLDIPNDNKSNMCNLSLNKEFKAAFSYPGEIHYYKINIANTSANKDQKYIVGITMFEGDCDLQLLVSDPISTVSAHNDSLYFPEPNQKSIETNLKQAYVKVYLREGIPFERCIYTLQLIAKQSVDTKIVQSQAELDLVPNITLLPISVTRFISTSERERNDVTHYAAANGTGSKDIFAIDLKKGGPEWTIESAAELILENTPYFIDWTIVSAGPDMGLCATFYETSEEQKTVRIEKIVWMKDFNINLIQRNLIMTLKRQDAPELRFKLPVFDKKSSYFILPFADTALLGPGKFMMDLDIYSDTPVTIFIPLDLFQDLKIIDISSENITNCILFAGNTRYSGYDLYIENTKQTLYIRNYYRNPSIIRFSIVDNIAGTTSPDDRQLIMLPSSFKDSISSYLTLSNNKEIVQLLVPGLIEGLINSVENPGPGLDLIRYLIGNESSVCNTSSSALTKYLKMHGIPYLSPLDSTIIFDDLEYNGNAIISDSTRKAYRAAVLLNKASRGTMSEAELKKAIHIKDFEYLHNLWLQTDDAARYAVILFKQGVDTAHIAAGYILQLSVAQMITYKEKMKDTFVNNEDFYRYASLISSFAAELYHKVFNKEMAPMIVGSSMSEKDKKLLRAGIAANGYLSARTEALASDMEQMSFIPNDILMLSQLRDLNWNSGWRPSQALKLLKEGVSAQDLMDSIANRTQYESGNRNHLITITTSTDWVSRQGVYHITEPVSLSDWPSNDPWKLNAGGNDLQKGTITGLGGVSPAPDDYESLQKRGNFLLYMIKDRNYPSDFLKMETIMISYARSTVDNMIDGINDLNQTSEINAWRPVTHYDKDGKPVDIHFDGNQSITFEFKHKIILTALHLYTKIERASQRFSKYRVEVYKQESKSWVNVTPNSFVEEYSSSVANLNIPIDTSGIPYASYRLVGEKGHYDWDRWILEVTFDTAGI
ncbi:hypothetical protein [Chryseobacterium indologenes]|uniref:Peptidase C80 domain-containing protein n=1 Tax=Chryseobacterium indologenes TaxID=253 RepID=A0A0N0IXT4_CHRID|nr:hypothetical protein [Chryseobacterium indologenes]KPE52504.1 hypothetical protein AOB46_00290 [Chryseobacterium indologenes]